jgi:hypothetical protein
LNQVRYEREPGWLLGTHRTRRVLVQGLWIHGSTGAGPVETGSAAAQPFCRAAVLLAAQEGFPFGAATLYWLLRDPRFSERTGWTEKTVTSVRALMEAERARTGQYVSVLTAAVEAMDPMMRAEKGVDDPNVEVFMDRAEQLAGLSGHRPDVQWRLANLVWRLANVARRHNRPDVLSRVELATRRWNNLLAEPAAARWFEEALMAEAPAFRTTGVRRISSDAFERDYHRVGPEPST